MSGCGLTLNFKPEPPNPKLKRVQGDTAADTNPALTLRILNCRNYGIFLIIMGDGRIHIIRISEWGLWRHSLDACRTDAAQEVVWCASEVAGSCVGPRGLQGRACTMGLCRAQGVL